MYVVKENYIFNNISICFRSIYRYNNKFTICDFNTKYRNSIINITPYFNTIKELQNYYSQNLNFSISDIYHGDIKFLHNHIIER